MVRISLPGALLSHKMQLGVGVEYLPSQHRTLLPQHQHKASKQTQASHRWVPLSLLLFLNTFLRLLPPLVPTDLQHHTHLPIY